MWVERPINSVHDLPSLIGTWLVFDDIDCELFIISQIVASRCILTWSDVSTSPMMDVSPFITLYESADLQTRWVLEVGACRSRPVLRLPWLTSSAQHPIPVFFSSPSTNPPSCMLHALHILFAIFIKNTHLLRGQSKPHIIPNYISSTLRGNAVSQHHQTYSD